MNQSEWLELKTRHFKISWTKLYKAIQRANKRYPYKLWMCYNVDDKPCYYEINNLEDELMALAHFSPQLKYAEEIYDYTT